jgi:hypothetical protein
MPLLLVITRTRSRVNKTPLAPQQITFVSLASFFPWPAYPELLNGRLMPTDGMSRNPAALTTLVFAARVRP